ncbi:chorismate mutase [Ectopseudomonas khazarica]|uniref:chorismate mutase n=1 Tax=Ectopseudomonas khazarica TaxID=2502979 RepID=UPI001AF0169B|nr:chorismate mutase [Pseudomonas khazarica]QTS88189.1 chorismate mutase [Pseudomonas khazarica]
MDVQCSSLEDVRQRIDEIDRAMVELIARRGGFVAQAARFKKDSADVRASARVEQVIAKVRALASERGASAEVVEQVYRAMIAAFIDEELRTHAALGAEGGAV